MQNTPVLVTGGAGYIGSHAVLALLDAGWPVAVIDNLSNGTREVVPGGVPFYEGSIGDRALVDVAKVLGERMRGTDSLCRWSGEEFMILAPHLDLEDAVRMADKLRGALGSKR